MAGLATRASPKMQASRLPSETSPRRSPQPLYTPHRRTTESPASAHAAAPSAQSASVEVCRTSEEEEPAVAFHTSNKMHPPLDYRTPDRPSLASSEPESPTSNTQHNCKWFNARRIAWMRCQ